MSEYEGVATSDAANVRVAIMQVFSTTTSILAYM
jgi:hypothetical protein